jgi:periplasmic copper chaperone A
MRVIFKNTIGKMLLAVMLSGSTGLATAHGVSKGDLLIDHPYATPSLAAVPNGSTYFRGIRNKGEVADRLIGASTPAAERVELHRMSMNGGVMRMRQVNAIDLPPGKTVPMRHGGEYHLMLVNVVRPLKDGDRFELTLQFERAGTQSVKVWVQTPRRAAADAEHSHEQ